MSIPGFFSVFVGPVSEYFLLIPKEISLTFSVGHYRNMRVLLPEVSVFYKVWVKSEKLREVISLLNRESNHQEEVIKRIFPARSKSQVSSVLYHLLSGGSLIESLAIDIVSRSSFYSHYTDTRDFADNLESIMRASGVLDVLDVLETPNPGSNNPDYKFLIKSTPKHFTDKIIGFLSDYVSKMWDVLEKRIRREDRGVPYRFESLDIDSHKNSKLMTLANISVRIPISSHDFNLTMELKMKLLEQVKDWLAGLKEGGRPSSRFLLKESDPQTPWENQEFVFILSKPTEEVALKPRAVKIGVYQAVASENPLYMKNEYLKYGQKPNDVFLLARHQSFLFVNEEDLKKKNFVKTKIHKPGFNFFISLIPEEKDPEKIVKALSKTAFLGKKSLAGSGPFLSYLLSLILSGNLAKVSRHLNVRIDAMKLCHGKRELDLLPVLIGEPSRLEILKNKGILNFWRSEVSLLPEKVPSVDFLFNEIAPVPNPRWTKAAKADLEYHSEVKEALLEGLVPSLKSVLNFLNVVEDVLERKESPLSYGIEIISGHEASGANRRAVYVLPLALTERSSEFLSAFLSPDHLVEFKSPETGRHWFTIGGYLALIFPL